MVCPLLQVGVLTGLQLRATPCPVGLRSARSLTWCCGDVPRGTRSATTMSALILASIFFLLIALASARILSPTLFPTYKSSDASCDVDIAFRCRRCHGSPLEHSRNTPPEVDSALILASNVNG
jgi:hypothetical protein